jgi:hypothetical protein
MSLDQPHVGGPNLIGQMGLGLLQFGAQSAQTGFERRPF